MTDEQQAGTTPDAVSPASMALGAPAVEPAQVSAVGELYSPRQIMFAAFLGSPVAATWFIWRNHKTLGHADRPARALWLGTAATLVVFAILIAIVVAFPSLVPA